LIDHNNCPSDYGVVYVEGGGSIKIMYCIFQNNENYLFSDGGSLEVSHSFISQSGSFSIYTAVSTSNNNSITHLLQFFKAIQYNADIPLLDITPLITLEKSPKRSLSEATIRTNDETLRITYERLKMKLHIDLMLNIYSLIK